MNAECETGRAAGGTTLKTPAAPASRFLPGVATDMIQCEKDWACSN
jgi:hypothetical protein